MNVDGADIVIFCVNSENKTVKDISPIALFNLFFNVTFNIYDDYESLLAFTEVEINRSVTSKTLISLNEKEQILEDLVYKSLEDFANKSEEMAKEYLSEYIL